MLHLVVLRWAGLITGVLVAGILFSGKTDQRRLKQRLLAVVLIVGPMLLTFAATRYTLAWLAERSLRTQGISTAPSVSTAIPLMANPQRYPRNLSVMGSWVSRLLWQVTEFAVVSPNMEVTFNLLGWLLMAVFAFQAFWSLRQGQWVWLAVLCYTLVLATIRSRVNVRYLVPVSAFLLTGIVLGLRTLGEKTPKPWLGKLLRGVCLVGLGSVAVCNLTLMSVDIWIARSGDFYGRYFAGVNKELIQAAKHLNDAGLADGELAVSPSYVNLGRTVTNLSALRAMVMLTDKIVVGPGPKYGRMTPEEALPSLAAADPNVKYYFYRPPLSPWRVWHLQLAWLQEWVTGQPVTVHNPGFELYQLREGQALKVNLKEAGDWPRAVPGVKPCASWSKSLIQPRSTSSNTPSRRGGRGGIPCWRPRGTKTASSRSWTPPASSTCAFPAKARAWPGWRRSWPCAT